MPAQTASLDRAKLVAGAHLGSGDPQLGVGKGLAPGGLLLGPLVDQDDDHLEILGGAQLPSEGAQQRRPAGAPRGPDENPLATGQRRQQIDRAKQQSLLGLGARAAERQAAVWRNGDEILEPRALAARLGAVDGVDVDQRRVALAAAGPAGRAA